MKQRRAIDRRLATILLIVFVQMTGAAMILPILPLYAKREFALSPQVITLLSASFFAAQFLAGPWLGRLSDRHGRLPILIISQIGTVLSFVLLGAAPNATLLFVARIVDGITGGNIIVAQAYVTDITPRERRTESLGYIFAVFGLGFILGPAIGGLLSAAFGPRLPYYFAAGAASIPILLTWLVLDETVTVDKHQDKQSAARNRVDFKLLLGNRLLVWVLVIAFVGQFAFGLLQATFALYGEAILFVGASERETNLGIGLLLTAVGVGQFITQTVILRRLLPRLGDAWLVVVGNIARGLSFAVFAVISSPLLGAVASFTFALGMGLLMPPLQSLTTRLVPDNIRGAILGVYQSTLNLGVIVSTAISGVIFAINPTAPSWLGAALSVVVLLPALYLTRSGAGLPAATPAAPTATD